LITWLGPASSSSRWRSVSNKTSLKSCTRLPHLHVKIDPVSVYHNVSLWYTHPTNNVK
jgi:hypothetical protein